MSDQYVDAALGRMTPFSEPIQEYVTADCWGNVWGRPGLDRKTRSMLTLAILATLRVEDELAGHVRGAIRNGVTPQEITEVLLHTTVYAGAPAGLAAFRTAQRALAEMGIKEAATPSKGLFTNGTTSTAKPAAAKSKTTKAAPAKKSAKR